MAKKQPGTMLYFDIRPCLKRLSTQEKGILFEAILDYGEFGAVPELEGQLGVAWDFIQPRLDRDRERYEEISRKRTEAIKARWDKNRCVQDSSNESKPIQMDSNEYKSIQTIPTTTTTPSTTPSPSPSTTPTSTPTGGGRQSRPKTEEQKFEDMRKQRMRMLQGGK